MNKYKIDDIVLLEDGDTYRITELPGCSDIYEDCYRGIDINDGLRGLFTGEDVVELINNVQEMSEKLMGAMIDTSGITELIRPEVPQYDFYESEMPATFDCDDTLVVWDIGQNCPYDMWSYEEQQKCKPEDVVRIEDPYKVGDVYYLVKHNRHIKLLHDYKERGFGIIVWSAGGALWAKAVVDALGIGPDVDLVMAKPNRHVDDMPCTTWMGERIYIDRNKH